MKETRLSTIKAELRADEAAASESLILWGQPILYDTPTTIHDPAGDYIEIIKRGALEGADLSDVRLLYNHDTNKIPLARAPKTMELKKGTAGLELTATLPDTQEARAVYEAVKRGDLDGMSFCFTVPEGGDSYDPKTNTRTITKIAKVYECSVVVFPAYPQTSVEARTARTESLKNYKARQNAKILCNKILLKSEV